MKIFLTIAVSLSFTAVVIAQNIVDSGFTNKSDAKNLIVNGVKEGKWIQYYKVKDKVVHETKSKHAPFYRLTMYKAGKAVGIARDYYKSGKLWGETPYVNGNINGLRKMYDDNGVLILTDTVFADKENGIIKIFYLNGKLKIECPFINDTSNKQAVISFEPHGAIHSYQGAEPTIPYGISGKLNGVLKIYNEDGSLKLKTTFLNGIAIK